MTLLEQMPSRPVITVCLVAGIVAATLAADGLLSRTMLAIALLAALLLNGMHTSRGKVMHSDVLLVLCVIAIVFARMVTRGHWTPGAPADGGRPPRRVSRPGRRTAGRYEPRCS